MKIILASNSPRRKELLEKSGLTFSVIPSSVEENISKSLPPVEYAKTLALIKAQDVFSKRNGIVIGADTIVVFNDKIIGKPTSEQDAFNTLKMLSGKTHQVITGYAVLSKNATINDYCLTEVTFNELSNELICDYIKNAKPLDKAGSYGIQDGYPLVKCYNGDYDNIVGLPTSKILEILRSLYET